MKSEIMWKEIERIKRELEIAERQFNEAEEPFVAAAVYNLLAKRELLNAMLKKAREESECA